MANLWPWLAIAGLGAMHGLSPATGWMFAAAWGVRAGDGAQVRRALLPIAIGHAGIALWSFAMATVHGAGLMLVPALVPLCLADNPAREITASGSLVLALAAVGVHTAAMLVTTGVIATGVCRGLRFVSAATCQVCDLRPGWTRLRICGMSRWMWA